MEDIFQKHLSPWKASELVLLATVKSPLGLPCGYSTDGLHGWLVSAGWNLPLDSSLDLRNSCTARLYLVLIKFSPHFTCRPIVFGVVDG